MISDGRGGHVDARLVELEHVVTGLLGVTVGADLNGAAGPLVVDVAGVGQQLHARLELAARHAAGADLGHPGSHLGGIVLVGLHRGERDQVHAVVRVGGERARRLILELGPGHRRDSLDLLSDGRGKRLDQLRRRGPADSVVDDDVRRVVREPADRLAQIGQHPHPVLAVADHDHQISLAVNELGGLVDERLFGAR